MINFNISFYSVLGFCIIVDIASGWVAVDTIYLQFAKKTNESQCTCEGACSYLNVSRSFILTFVILFLIFFKSFLIWSIIKQKLLIWQCKVHEWQQGSCCSCLGDNFVVSPCSTSMFYNWVLYIPTEEAAAYTVVQLETMLGP